MTTRMSTNMHTCAMCSTSPPPPRWHKLAQRVHKATQVFYFSTVSRSSAPTHGTPSKVVHRLLCRHDSPIGPILQLLQQTHFLLLHCFALFLLVNIFPLLPGVSTRRKEGVGTLTGKATQSQPPISVGLRNSASRVCLPNSIHKAPTFLEYKYSLLLSGLRPTESLVFSPAHGTRLGGGGQEWVNHSTLPQPHHIATTVVQQETATSTQQWVRKYVPQNSTQGVGFGGYVGGGFRGGGRSCSLFQTTQ
jgi:hypothetical protein